MSQSSIADPAIPHLNQPPIAGSAILTPRKIAVLACHGLVAVLLFVHFKEFLTYALAAVRYPYEIDYGEGIVWQQAMLITGTRMYGDIAQFPYIVFHYPPVYHLAVRAAAALTGDGLIAGRGVSLLSELLLAALAGALAHDAVPSHFGRIARVTGAIVASLTVFCYIPMILWSPVMRVDFLAIMLSFLGVWIAGRSARHPWLLHAAVLAFVLSVYTKQTSIAAPIAVLIVTWMVDRRRAMQAFGMGLVLGTAVLLELTWYTGGGFIRHVFLYNLNRFSLNEAASFLSQQWPESIFFALALAGAATGGRLLWNQPGNEGARFWTGARQNRLMAMVLLYFVAANCMLATIGKSGAAPNYLIEWMCLWSVLIGILAATTLGGILNQSASVPAGPGGVLGFVVPAALAAQIVMMPATRYYEGLFPEKRAQLDTLLARIRDARSPVLSDDMVLLMEAGKAVPWEPAIFAELASTGRWEERLILDRILRHDFAFVVTRGQPGTNFYDSLYTPAVNRAIHDAYPRAEEIGIRTVHLPPTGE